MLEKGLFNSERFNSSFSGHQNSYDPIRDSKRKKAPKSDNSVTFQTRASFENRLYTTKRSPLEPISRQSVFETRSMSDAHSERSLQHENDVHPVLELDYTELKKSYKVLSRLLAREPNSNKIYDAIGRDGLLKMMEKHSPNTLRQLAETRKEVEDLNEGQGYVVIRNTGVDLASSEPELAKLITITLASVYGFPTRHDGKEIAWPIHLEKPNTVQEKPNATGSSTLRFGGGSGEAPFHTDTSYFPEPEYSNTRFHTDTSYFPEPADTFVLTCLKPAKQGGVNQLVDAWKLAKQIKEERPEVCSILTNTQFLFRTATIYTKLKRQDITEITSAPIISPEGIRYRPDVLLLTKLSPEQLKAVEIFEQYLSNAPASEYLLKPGEAIFMNNRRMLHARTFHNDKDRLLIRVRMSKEQ
jgi:alpha-ketoglutarate-dependent taurine dioxygenase